MLKQKIKVKLYEMKPQKYTPAHSNENLAEIVCSNSFKSNLLTNACGLLKEELRRLDSLLIRIADETKVPANISKQTTQKAMDLAKRVMEVFEGVGMFCVEMFVNKQGNVLVNEVAPRPHNSGHYTIEACVTSQFEQHIRAITALPLGSPELLKPVVMRNLLGEQNSAGKSCVLGADEALAISGVFLHIYGKEESRPKRKMGHITVIADSVEQAAEKAEKAKNALKIYGESKSFLD